VFLRFSRSCSRQFRLLGKRNNRRRRAHRRRLRVINRKLPIKSNPQSQPTSKVIRINPNRAITQTVRAAACNHLQGRVRLPKAQWRSAAMEATALARAAVERVRIMAGSSSGYTEARMRERFTGDSGRRLLVEALSSQEIVGWK